MAQWSLLRSSVFSDPLQTDMENRPYDSKKGAATYRVCIPVCELVVHLLLSGTYHLFKAFHDLLIDRKANFYLTFYFIAGSLSDPKLDPFGHNIGLYIFTILRFACVLLICTQFILSMGNRPQGYVWPRLRRFALRLTSSA